MPRPMKKNPRASAKLRASVELSAQLREVEAEQRQYRYLRREGLRRRDADFRTRGRDERVADLAVDRRAADVRDYEALRAARLSETRCVQRVRRLA